MGGGEHVEVARGPGHPVPGEAGVTREEAQSRLPDPGLHLLLLLEQVTISTACIVRHIKRFHGCSTYIYICELKPYGHWGKVLLSPHVNVWITHTYKVRPQSSDRELYDIIQHLKCVLLVNFEALAWLILNM